MDYGEKFVIIVAILGLVFFMTQIPGIGTFFFAIVFGVLLITGVDRLEKWVNKNL